MISHTLCSLCLQPLWQLHPAGIHSHTQLLIPDHLSTAAASLLTEVRLKAWNTHNASVLNIMLSDIDLSIMLLHSCFSLTLAIAWVLEVEVWVTSSAIPSSAASPGKLWAASRWSCCTSDPSCPTLELKLNTRLNPSILVWPKWMQNQILVSFALCASQRKIT